MPAEAAIRYSEAELGVLAGLAHDEILAGLAHRFDQPTEVEVDAGGSAFLGAALASSALRLNLRLLEPAIARIIRRTTSARSRVRMTSSDPLAGQLDIARVGLRISDAAPWPIVRIVQSKNTPENALLIAAMFGIQEWAANAYRTYRGWTGRELFSLVAREAQRYAELLEGHFGLVELAALGAPRLLPLARERLAFRQADPAVYGDAIDLVERSLPLIDARRGHLRRVGNALADRLEAVLGDANQSGLPNDIFELWVIAVLLRAAEEQGFAVEYPAAARTPFAVASKATAQIDVWWQTSYPILNWPSGRDTERHRTDGGWAPVALRPDITVTLSEPGTRSIIFVECKNKKVRGADSKDVAQSLGYLAHYDALTIGALVYRSLDHVEAYRRVSTGQGIFALGAAVEPDALESGRRVLALVGA